VLPAREQVLAPHSKQKQNAAALPEKTVVPMHPAVEEEQIPTIADFAPVMSVLAGLISYCNRPLPGAQQA